MIKYQDLEEKLMNLDSKTKSFSFIEDESLRIFVTSNDFIYECSSKADEIISLDLYGSLNLIHYDDLIINKFSSKYNLNSALIKELGFFDKYFHTDLINNKGVFFKKSLKNVDEIEQVFSSINKAQKEIQKNVKYLLRRKNSFDYNYFNNIINYLEIELDFLPKKNSIETTIEKRFERFFFTKQRFIIEQSKFSFKKQKYLFEKFKLIEDSIRSFSCVILFDSPLINEEYRSLFFKTTKNLFSLRYKNRDLI